MDLLRMFRSKERDITTDIARVKPIFDTVLSALRDAEKELEGLAPRLADVGENEEAARGKIRERYLNEEIQALRRTKLLLEGMLSPETPAAVRK